MILFPAQWTSLLILKKEYDMFLLSIVSDGAKLKSFHTKSKCIKLAKQRWEQHKFRKITRELWEKNTTSFIYKSVDVFFS